MANSEDKECPACSSTNAEVVCVQCGAVGCEDCMGLSEAVEWVCAAGCSHA